MDLQNILKYKIKQARKEKKLTQEKIAELINIDATYYAKIETGKVFPSFKVLTRIVNLLEFSIDDMLKQDDKPANYHALIDLLEKCEEDDIEIILSTTNAILERKEKDTKGYT